MENILNAATQAQPARIDRPRYNLGRTGAVDCFIVFGTNYTLKYLRNTDAAKQLAKAIADTKQYDVIMQKLSTIMTADQLESFVQALMENGIKKGVEPLWAK
jgi:hypothetical protein